MEADILKTLTAVPVEQWQTKQVIVFDWYDGPRQGFCSLAYPEVEFVFDLLDERHNPDGLDYRLYSLRELPRGTVVKTLTLLGDLGNPTHGVWVPTWTFASAANQKKAEQFIEDAESKARPIPLAIASQDFEHIQGCYPTENTNGERVDWFSTLGVPSAP